MTGVLKLSVGKLRHYKFFFTCSRNNWIFRVNHVPIPGLCFLSAYGACTRMPLPGAALSDQMLFLGSWNLAKTYQRGVAERLRADFLADYSGTPSSDAFSQLLYEPF